MKQTVREEIVLKDNKLRYAEYYGMTEIFDELYEKSTQGASFKSLMNIIISDENIQLAYRTSLCQAFLGTLLTPVFLALCFCTLFPATARWSSLGGLPFCITF